MKIGAHVSSSGSFDLAVDRAVEIGAEAIQTFASPPQTWVKKKFKPGEADLYRQKSAESEVRPTVLHGIYLVNLATADPAHLEKGIDSLRTYLEVAHNVGAMGVIFHVGSHKGLGFEEQLEQICRSMVQALDGTPEDTWLIMETSAGSGNNIGSRFSQLGMMIRDVGSERLKVCVDTAHVYASGYDIKTHDGLERAMEEFEREVGLERLVAVHANDSKVGLGVGVDRHENIGEGTLGIEGFENIMAHAAFAEIPFFLEVPGFDGNGPDRRNVEILKAIRERVLS